MFNYSSPPPYGQFKTNRSCIASKRTSLICTTKVVSIPRNNEIYNNLDIPKTMSAKTFKGYQRT